MLSPGSKAVFTFPDGQCVVYDPEQQTLLEAMQEGNWGGRFDAWVVALRRGVPILVRVGRKGEEDVLRWFVWRGDEGSVYGGGFVDVVGHREREEWEGCWHCAEAGEQRPVICPATRGDGSWSGRAHGLPEGRKTLPEWGSGSRSPQTGTPGLTATSFRQPNRTADKTPTHSRPKVNGEDPSKNTPVHPLRETHPQFGRNNNRPAHNSAKNFQNRVDPPKTPSAKSVSLNGLPPPRPHKALPTNLSTDLVLHPEATPQSLRIGLIDNRIQTLPLTRTTLQNHIPHLVYPSPHYRGTYCAHPTCPIPDSLQPWTHLPRYPGTYRVCPLKYDPHKHANIGKYLITTLTRRASLHVQATREHGATALVYDLPASVPLDMMEMPRGLLQFVGTVTDFEAFLLRAGRFGIDWMGGRGWCLFDQREGFGKDSVPQRGVGKTVAKTLGRGDEVAALPRSSHGARSRGVSSRPTGSLNDDLSRKGNGQPAPPGKTDSSHAHYPPEQTGLSKNPKTLASKTDPEKSGDTPNGFKNNSREPAVPNDQGCTPPTAKTHSVSPVNQVPVLKTDPGPAEPKTHTEAKPISTNPTASSPPTFKNEQRYKAKAILLQRINKARKQLRDYEVKLQALDAPLVQKKPMVQTPTRSFPTATKEAPPTVEYRSTAGPGNHPTLRDEEGEPKLWDFATVHSDAVDGERGAVLGLDDGLDDASVFDCGDELFPISKLRLDEDEDDWVWISDKPRPVRK